MWFLPRGVLPVRWCAAVVTAAAAHGAVQQLQTAGRHGRMGRVKSRQDDEARLKAQQDAPGQFHGAGWRRHGRRVLLVEFQKGSASIGRLQAICSPHRASSFWAESMHSTGYLYRCRRDKGGGEEVCGAL